MGSSATQKFFLLQRCIPFTFIPNLFAIAIFEIFVIFSQINSCFRLQHCMNIAGI